MRRIQVFILCFIFRCHSPPLRRNFAFIYFLPCKCQPRPIWNGNVLGHFILCLIQFKVPWPGRRLWLSLNNFQQSKKLHTYIRFFVFFFAMADNLWTCQMCLSFPSHSRRSLWKFIHAFAVGKRVLFIVIVVAHKKWEFNFMRDTKPNA